MPTSLRRLPLAVVAAALLLLAAALQAPSALAQYPLTSGTLSVSGASGPLEPGESVLLSGGGFRPGAEVEIWLNSDPIFISAVNASATGAIDVSVQIPTNAPAGRHTLEARGAAPGGGTLVLRAPVVIAASDSAGSGGAADNEKRLFQPGSSDASSGSPVDGQLPFTGLPVLAVVGAGAALLIAGGLLSVFPRRRA